MITTTSMQQLVAAVLKSDMEAATEALLKVGVIDFIDVREIPADWTSRLDRVPAAEDREKARELRLRLDAYFRTVGFTPRPKVNGEKQEQSQDQEPLDLSEAEGEIDKLGGEFRKIRDKQKEVQEEILRLQELRRQMPDEGGRTAGRSSAKTGVRGEAGSRSDSGAGGPALTKGSHAYITVHTGTLPKENRAAFEKEIAKLPSVYLPEQGVAAAEGGEPIDFLITLKRDNSRVERLLEKYGWEERQYQESSGDGQNKTRLPVEELDAKLESLRYKQQELDKGLSQTVEERSETLERLWTGLRMRELLRTIQGYYRKTERTYLFSGWLPTEKKEEVTKTLMEATEGRCYLEWHTPHKGGDPEVPQQVPVQMKNPEALRPFQSLVENYGIPTYGSIDPTPMVAVFYLAMFALMFGDVGHGVVVLLIGLIGDRRSRKKGKKTMIYPLISYCGAAAIVSGALFGSYFGTALLPPLWFDYHGIVAGHEGGAGSVKTMSDILMLTIYFGIAVIGTGLLINWVNRLRRQDWFGLVWGNGGLLVGWIYAAGTYTAFYFAGHDYKELPEGPVLLLLLGLPVLLLAAKPVLEHVHHNRDVPAEQRHSANVLDMIMEWLVELLEIFSGYLSNTLSFMRVAGLGIAHVSLMMAFFQIAEMAASNGNFTIWSYLILLLGNALVIGLEGLSAGIQSLRLNYYEFFSKYFAGNGRAYAPISLRSE
ncbi:MAG: ATPase V [Spirochaetaceae bacterium]|nr:ATPase V [Spirochaetaceae bacterium]MCF7947653.1 ATPase V [Spirochaetia bacterium]MCF7951373.1 ATPase V [Spirochaetaceae bacterium]